MTPLVNTRRPLADALLASVLVSAFSLHLRSQLPHATLGTLALVAVDAVALLAAVSLWRQILRPRPGLLVDDDGLECAKGRVLWRDVMGAGTIAEYDDKENLVAEYLSLRLRYGAEIQRPPTSYRRWGVRLYEPTPSSPGALDIDVATISDEVREAITTLARGRRRGLADRIRDATR